MPMQKLPEKIDSKFRFVLLAAHRAEQIMRGARPRRPDDKRKLTRIAMHEIMNAEIAWDYGPEEVVRDESTDFMAGVFTDGPPPEEGGKTGEGESS